MFYLAFWAEKNTKSKWLNHPFIYTLSLAVYCTAWTYYGSVGLAANNSFEFLPIYLGPIIAMPLWIVVTRKIIYLSKANNIASIADFISLRYGNNRSLGAMITVLCLVAIVPYLSLQIKAVAESFQIIVNEQFTHQYLLGDYTFYITLILALFAAFFGTLSSDASNRKRGIIFSVAVESMIKLTFFIAIGLYVIFYLFNGTTDIYNQIKTLHPQHLSSDFGLESGFNWMILTALSFLAIFLLPRQFQMSVVEYVDRFQMKSAIWGFPLYLLIFNIFVLFIAWGGILLLGENVNQDYYSLLIPLHQNHQFLATLVFLGGFSAAMSMVVVSSIALATMLSNNLIIPYGLLDYFANRFSVQNEKSIKNIRRITIFSLIIISYFLYISWNQELSLISIGLISFVIIAQLAPSFFIGLYWNRGSSLGAKWGIVLGFIIVFLTLINPFTQETIFGTNNLAQNGYFGSEHLKPYALFGLDFLTPINHSLFWSLGINIFTYLFVSVSFENNYRERNYGEMFANANKISTLHENAFVWKGTAYYKDIQELLYRFLGEKRADRAINIFKRKYNISSEEELADARFINFSEKLLTGTIGSASAKILIGSVVKEKPVSLSEVLNILEDNKEARTANKTLTHQSHQLMKLTNQLKIANDELILQDKQKDSFLDTVAHELKTPITAIKAASEVLQDEEMPAELREKFLQNIINDTDRLTKLINNILDLEKLSSGRETLHLKQKDLIKTLVKSVEIVRPLADKNGVKILFEHHVKNSISTASNSACSVVIDDDKMIQVFTNLLGNALKFAPKNTGEIKIQLNSDKYNVFCSITDNGKGIDTEDIPYIFDKFFQTKNQHLKKPSGSGFGLAISKQIVEMHGGKIYADKSFKNGAKFIIELPKKIK